jgi:hypothetical protein
MRNAGSALMGIGRASGENRAVLAAQQAIDSPLLEVSIDGARGILFNVIGGNDLSMHEINAAAEAITSAADPEANIIFGATIDDKLSGELIITVVATGFDAAYFGNRRPQEEIAAAPAAVSPELLDEATNAPVHSVAPQTPQQSAQQTDPDLSDVDLTLDDTTDHATDFKSDAAMPNIWTIDEPEETKPSILHDDSHGMVSHDVDEELEKPSFLRRLTKRHKDTDSNDHFGV